MQGTWRLGRIGQVNLYLSYTWILTTLLIMWWIGLLWLPENFPSWGPTLNWLIAGVVTLLFLGSVIAHELVHSIVAPSGAVGRNANLFPFGAAVPFRLERVGARRALLSALAAPVFNIVLGGILLLLGAAFSDPDNALRGLSAILTPLGFLNLWLGLLNLVPGIPFDGGWVLVAGTYYFTNDREGGFALASTLGRIAALVLVIIGAWRGLVSDQWLDSLALVMVGWAAWQSGLAGQQRNLVRGLLENLRARDFMEPAWESDTVSENATVAELVKAHPKFPPAIPLPVVDSAGALLGVTSLGAASTLLQGTWATTPVRSITLPVTTLRSVTPDTPLINVLGLLQDGIQGVLGDRDDVKLDGATSAQFAATGATPDPASEDVLFIPVIEDNSLVGSINPDKIYAFEEAGQQFGVQETMPLAQKVRSGGWSKVLGFMPLVMLLAAVAILGNIALRTDPEKLQESVTDPDSTITFSQFAPAEGEIIGLGARTISVQVEAARPVVSATIWIDGEPATTILSGASALTQTASANVSGFTLGLHTARITAVEENGRRKSHEWQFRVLPGAPGPDSTPTVQNTPTPQLPVSESLDTSDFSPRLGSRLPAGEEATLSLVVVPSSEQSPSEVKIYLDAQELDARIEPVAEAAGTYRIIAQAPALLPGGHRVRVEVTGAGGGTITSEWTFTALIPNQNNAYFQETGYFVTQPFLGYWQENGGLGLFGYPISDIMQETDDATGEVYTAQYFERARFELHPSQGDIVLLGRLGAILHAPEEPVSPIEGAQFFPETGHNLSGIFLDYWNANGGLAVFGFPISEERVEKNPVDGKEYSVQYFERNRFELHPENAGTPFEVQLGLLGAELYQQLYAR